MPGGEPIKLRWKRRAFFAVHMRRASLPKSLTIDKATLPRRGLLFIIFIIGSHGWLLFRRADARRFPEGRMIGIGAAVTRRPLPHHRAYGSVHGGSSRLR
jgi:hypothetical protein